MSRGYVPDHRTYMEGRAIYMEDHTFYALIEAAMRKADSVNTAILREAYPNVYADLMARYDAPGGYLPGEEGS